METFLQQIRTSSDRNFLLAVKYSDIFEQVQKRLDFLNERAVGETAAPSTTTTTTTTTTAAAVAVVGRPAKHEAAAVVDFVVAEPPPEDASLPAIRDSPEKARSQDDDGNHHAYPNSVVAVSTEEELREVLASNEDKFVVVKLGADWCKPCVKVHTMPLLSCSSAWSPATSLPDSLNLHRTAPEQEH
jgi:hypothetical protein